MKPLTLKEEVKRMAKEIYATLGAGYEEGIYHRAFEVELRLKGINYESEKPVEVVYKGHSLGVLFADLYVWQGNEKVLIELKAGKEPIGGKYQKKPNSVKEVAQVSNYYKLLELPEETGILLINFPFPGTSEAEIVEVR
ncbi:MAG: GxxExxY protein [candidate division WOR-3 bacterium]|nr:GxxExxY protein [candidate division WOR-3 bacterium]